MTPVQKRVKRFRYMWSELVALAIFLMLFVHLLIVPGLLIACAIVGLIQCHWLLWKDTKRRRSQ